MEYSRKCKGLILNLFVFLDVLWVITKPIDIYVNLSLESHQVCTSVTFYIIGYYYVSYLPLMRHIVFSSVQNAISDCGLVSSNYSLSYAFVVDRRSSPPSLVFSKAKTPMMEQRKHYWMSSLLSTIISKKMWALCLTTSLELLLFLAKAAFSC